MSDTTQRVSRILVEHLGIEAGHITPEAKLTDDLGADSLDMVELIMVIEEEFGVSIEDDDAEKLITVADLIKTAEAKEPTQ